MRRADSYEYVNEASISGTLICTICLAPLQSPQVNNCQHMFCRSCIHEWRNTGSGSCPTCRQPLSDLTSADRSVKSRLARLPVKCNKCGDTGIRRDSFDHHKQYACTAVRVVCLAADLMCRWEGRRGQLDAHLNSCFYHQMRPTLERLTFRSEQLQEQLDIALEDNRQLQFEARAPQCKSFCVLIVLSRKYEITNLLRGQVSNS